MMTQQSTTTGKKGWGNVIRNPAPRFGEMGAVYASGNEGGTRLLRRDDAVGRARHPRGDPLEAIHQMDRRGDPRPQADPVPVDPAQRSRRQGFDACDWRRDENRRYW